MNKKYTHFDCIFVYLVFSLNFYIESKFFENFFSYSLFLINKCTEKVEIFKIGILIMSNKRSNLKHCIKKSLIFYY